MTRIVSEPKTYLPPKKFEFICLILPFNKHFHCHCATLLENYYISTFFMSSIWALSWKLNLVYVHNRASALSALILFSIFRSSNISNKALQTFFCCMIKFIIIYFDFVEIVSNLISRDLIIKWQVTVRQLLVEIALHESHELDEFSNWNMFNLQQLIFCMHLLTIIIQHFVAKSIWISYIVGAGDKHILTIIYNNVNRLEL